MKYKPSLRRLISLILVVLMTTSSVWPEVIEGDLLAVQSYNSIKVRHSQGIEDFALYMPGQEPRSVNEQVNTKTQLNNLLNKTVYLQIVGKTPQGLRVGNLVAKPAPTPPPQTDQAEGVESIPEPTYQPVIKNPMEQQRQDAARMKAVREAERVAQERKQAQQQADFEKKFPIYKAIISIVILFILAYFGVVKKITLFDLFKRFK